MKFKIYPWKKTVNGREKKILEKWGFEFDRIRQGDLCAYCSRTNFIEVEINTLEELMKFTDGWDKSVVVNKDSICFHNFVLPNYIRV